MVNLGEKQYGGCIMQRRIVKVILLDSKQIWYPTDIEMKQLWNDVKSIVYEELMTKEEFEEKYFIVRNYAP